MDYHEQAEGERPDASSSRSSREVDLQEHQVDEYTRKLWEGFRDPYVSTRVLTCAAGLLQKDFEVIAAPTVSEANRIIVDRVDRHNSIYFWSTTLEELGIIDTLRARGNSVRSSLELSGERGFIGLRPRKPGRSDIYMTSVSAITLDGVLLNLAPEGASVFPPGPAPGTIIVVAGHNKIVDDLDEGIQRSRDICFPQYARLLGLDLPCVRVARCIECDTPHALCTVNTVITRKPAGTDFLVVLIGEHLGF